MPHDPEGYCSIAAGNDNLYAAMYNMRYLQYNVSTDTWSKLSSPALSHSSAALIFHQNLLLFLGGATVDIEGYDIASDTWVKAPYKLSEKLANHCVHDGSWGANTDLALTSLDVLT